MKTDWRQMMKEEGIAVIIPTYNNAGTVMRVIDDVLAYSEDVIVVDDGCTDGSSSLLASRDDIRLIVHERNMGKGMALKHALAAAKAAGFSYAVTIDADGQHYASDIPVFLEEIRKTPGSLLIGARNLASENMPGKNTFANRFSNFWYRLETGNRLEDTQSGFRLYPVGAMDFGKWYFTAKYEYELETIVFASWKGIPVRNVPVGVYYPPAGERVSHFHPFRDFTRISIVNTVFVILCLLWIWPRKLVLKLSGCNDFREFYCKHIAVSADSNPRISAAVMVGVFMGIVPIWGYQMIAAVAAAHLLRLNKAIAVIASNISIPPMIPFILYGSYFAGCKVLGQPLDMAFSEISLENAFAVLWQYVTGSFVLAALCSIAAGLVSIVLLSIFRKKR